jgi:putative transposase
MFFNPEEEVDKHGGKLPHWQQGEVMQFVTFRLADAMPQGKLKQWKEERDVWLKWHPQPWDNETEKEYFKRFIDKLEKWFDQGAGSCVLKAPMMRKHLEETLMFDQPERVEHHAWVIMPNHVHLLFTPKVPIEKLMKSWKGISARKIGFGSIWQKNYRDTMIRNARHFSNAVRYIRRNPAKLREGTFTLWESERAKAVG